MKSTSKSETAQTNPNQDNPQPNLSIAQNINILEACIKSELYRLGTELLMYRLLKEVYKDDDPEDEEVPDDDEEEEEDDDSIPDVEITDDDGWGEDFDENGLRYWVPDEIWNPVEEIDAEEETEPVDTRIVPIGWDVKQDYYAD